MDKNRINKVNLVYFTTIMLYITVSFIVLPFIKGQYVQLILSQLILFLPAAIYLFTEKVPLKEVIRLNRIKNTNIFFLVLLAFTISPVLTFINSLSMLFVENRSSTTIIQIVTDSPLLLSAVVVALLPAVFEEMAYRGLYFNSYRGAGVLKAALLSATMFALLHGNLNQFSYTIIIGLFFALIVEATGSIISSIIMHFIINISSVIQVYLIPTLMMLLEYTYYDAIDSGNNEVAALIENMVGGTDFSLDSMLSQSLESVERMTFSDVVSSYLPSAIIGGIISYFIFRKIARNEGRWDYVKSIFSRKQRDSLEISEKSDWRSLLTMPLIAGAIIMLTFMIVLEFI